MHVKSELQISPAPSASLILGAEDTRRTWPRYQYHGKMRILDPATRSLKGTGWLLDLSGGGVGFCAALDMSLHGFIIAEFDVEGRFMSIPACIMTRASETMYGAEFLHLDDSDRVLIDNALTHRAMAIDSAEFEMHPRAASHD